MVRWLQPCEFHENQFKIATCIMRSYTCICIEVYCHCGFVIEDLQNGKRDLPHSPLHKSIVSEWSLFRSKISLKITPVLGYRENNNWVPTYTKDLLRESSVLHYMAVLRPVWTYALPVWGCASRSLCHQIIQCFQNKMLRTIAGAPWFVRNDTLNHDIRTPTIDEVIGYLATRHEH